MEPVGVTLSASYSKGRMKIELNKKEYRQLLDLLEISTWVLFAYNTEKEIPADKKPYDALEQKLLSCAKENGCEDLVEYVDNLKKYFVSRKVEEGAARRFIDAFENDTFWDELIHRLAMRDFAWAEGDIIRNMSREERFRKISLRESLYSREFAKNGIENLMVKPRMDN